jgi:uncharacterized protein (TIGR03085 family)
VSVSSRERAALADLLAELGPDAPTLCEGWSTAHLAAHLVVRDRRPDALPGFGLEEVGVRGPLPAWSHHVEDRLRQSTPYAEVVARFRAGPPGWSPMGLPGLGKLFNTAEFVIHHEDVRRAQPGWSPRPLPRKAQDALWPSAVVFARRAAGRGCALQLRRTDASDGETRVGRGPLTTTGAGEPLELLLWAAGRKDAARVEVS